MSEDNERADRIRALKAEQPTWTWRFIADQVGVSERAALDWQKTGGISYDNAKKLSALFSRPDDFVWRGETPEPFPHPVALEGMQADILQAIMQQLAMQTKVLQEIKDLLTREGEVASALEVATARVDEASSTLAETAAQAGRVLRDGVPRPAAAAPKPARKRIPRASKRSPA